MNNEISNPKVEVSKGISLNDKDYVNCLLSNLKNIEKNYTISMTEASNETLYNKYLETFKKISDLQRETYELMFNYGWYKLETQEKQKITQKLNMLSEEYTNLKN